MIFVITRLSVVTPVDPDSPWFGASIMRTTVVPQIYSRFHKPADFRHNYPRAINIMACVDGLDWHNKSFTDLEDKDFVCRVACIASKRMGLHCGAQVDKYPIFNRLMYMALNDAQSEYL